MPHIFISYRRKDTAFAAHAIYEKLKSQYGDESVVFDVDSIPPGEDFVNFLSAEVGRCDVLLVIIGDNWLDVRDEGGRRRIDHPDDYVRTEIQAALERDIPVIPVLVESAPMPRRDELPEEIQVIARRNALAVRSGRNYNHELDSLLQSLERRFRHRREFEPTFVTAHWVVSALTLVAAGAAGSVVLSAVSISYNKAAIAPVPTDETLLLNGCMYGVAFVAGIYVGGGMWRTLGRYRPGETITGRDARQFANSALGLPYHISLFVLGLWLSSGIIIPVFMSIARSATIELHQYIRFFTVQTFLAPIAAAITYSLLAVTIFRYIFPVYTFSLGPDAHDQLAALERMATLARAILLCLPIPTFLCMTIAAFARDMHDEWQMLWLAVSAMVVTTFVSFAIAIWLLPRLRQDMRDVRR